MIRITRRGYFERLGGRAISRTDNPVLFAVYYVTMALSVLALFLFTCLLTVKAVIEYRTGG
jgi:hypothetical protein